MFNERQLIKFGILAERAHRLAFDIALQSASLGEHGVAIIADETRNIGNKIHSIFDSGDIIEADLLDMVMQLKYLSVNGSLELFRISNQMLQVKSTKPLAVIFDEIHNLTQDVENCFAVKRSTQNIIPRVSKKHPVIVSDIFCIAFCIDGSLFVENTQCVQEIVKNSSELQTNDGFLQLRGSQIPIISLGDKSNHNEAYEAVVILDMGDNEIRERYALFVDELPDIFVSKAGVSAQYRGEMPCEYVRECWDAEEENQMVFLSPKI